jgi:hypothetical protein
MVFGHRPAVPVSYFVRRLGAEPAPGCGRDVGYPTPPARIRTSVLTASGSCRESSAPAFGAWAAHAVPVPVMTAHQRRMIRCRARDVVCCHQLPATGALPSTTSPAGWGRRCSALHRYYEAVRLLASSAAATPLGFLPWPGTANGDCGRDEVSQLPTRSFCA